MTHNVKIIKTQVDIREVRRLKEQLGEINKLPLSMLEFMNDGSPVSVPQEVIDWWELTGLNNVDFITALLGGHRSDWGEGWRRRFLATLSEDKDSG